MAAAGDARDAAIEAGEYGPRAVAAISVLQKYRRMPPSARIPDYPAAAKRSNSQAPRVAGPSQACYSRVWALPGGLLGRRKFGLTLAAAIQAEMKDAALQDDRVARKQRYPQAG